MLKTDEAATMSSQICGRRCGVAVAVGGSEGSTFAASSTFMIRGPHARVRTLCPPLPLHDSGPLCRTSANRAPQQAPDRERTSGSRCYARVGLGTGTLRPARAGRRQRQRLHCWRWDKVELAPPAPCCRFPYVCSLRDSSGTQHVCGATLISDRLALTAAFCVTPPAGAARPVLLCGLGRLDDPPPGTFDVLGAEKVIT